MVNINVLMVLIVVSVRAVIDLAIGSSAGLAADSEHSHGPTKAGNILRTPIELKYPAVEPRLFELAIKIGKMS
jgi:hypothetical protein